MFMVRSPIHFMYERMNRKNASDSHSKWAAVICAHLMSFYFKKGWWLGMELVNFSVVGHIKMGWQLLILSYIMKLNSMRIMKLILTKISQFHKKKNHRMHHMATLSHGQSLIIQKKIHSHTKLFSSALTPLSFLLLYLRHYLRECGDKLWM